MPERNTEMLHCIHRWEQLFLHLNANVHLLSEPPTCVQASLSLSPWCLAGERVERLPVRLLLLSAILAPDLQRAEEKSSIPRLLLLVLLILGQIHRSRLPAGGALGLDARRSAPSFLPGLCRRRPSWVQELI